MFVTWLTRFNVMSWHTKMRYKFAHRSRYSVHVKYVVGPYAYVLY